MQPCFSPGRWLSRKAHSIHSWGIEHLHTRADEAVEAGDDNQARMGVVAGCPEPDDCRGEKRRWDDGVEGPDAAV